ncbi:hypothetical protein M409DRAFT_21691 [Zasmidium cellare ATCC 36951]|uniref:Thioesterase domain-containing protein n=1 Tax=Zasmidium cellare ATCC 36951 TaxID=1080233 RepID=A0A6A6CNN4_ZASCE|nr:uncharacterized protein M409DRAFT_21691 [Zasmidium cellare ATCC 36951]KAF2168253.1 hypothetical protein M409DRAFT_21691 [Zasmidium cellare ATCC 36951]
MTTPNKPSQERDSRELKDEMTQALLKGPARAKYDQIPARNFLLPFLDTVTITTATRLSPTKSHCTFRFAVLPEFLNPMGTLHAGATSAFFECATTWTLWPVARQPDFWPSLGVCRTIGFVYLRPVGVGEWCLMECETVHVGKRIALVKGELKREKDGAVLVTCEHNKVNVDADSKM